MKQVAIAVFLVFMIPHDRKPRFVHLDHELTHAVYIDYVRINGYKDSTILFTPIDGYEGYYSYKWSRDEKNIFHPFDKAKNFAALGRYHKAPMKELMTEGWPLKGDSVLIVIDSTARVSLFAKKQGNSYRFWSPRITGSVAMFLFNTPAVKVSDKLASGDTPNSQNTCRDGCLLPIDSLLTYGSGDRHSIFQGHAITSGGKALFISEYADSEPYVLEGIDKWSAQYENKTLLVSGILIQFVEGRSTIKNWRIRAIKDPPTP